MRAGLAARRGKGFEISSIKDKRLNIKDVFSVSQPSRLMLLFTFYSQAGMLALLSYLLIAASLPIKTKNS